MNRKSLLAGVLMGVTVSVLVGLVMTYIGWLENPGGVFHNELGVNWGNLFDTWLSWFVPVAVVTSPVSIAIMSWLLR